MLFTIQFINLLFMHNFLDYKNLKFKHLIDDIAIDFLSFENFANMKDARKKCNPMMDFTKFTFNKKILIGIVAIG